MGLANSLESLFKKKNNVFIYCVCICLHMIMLVEHASVEVRGRLCVVGSLLLPLHEF